MVYSDVINNNWHKLLPKKKKYTKKDAEKVLLASLFDKTLNNGTFSEKQAEFIVRCTAIFHEAECTIPNDMVKRIRVELTNKLLNGGRF